MPIQFNTLFPVDSPALSSTKQPTRRKTGPESNPLRDERTAQADLMAKKRASERDIKLPAVANPQRRAACENEFVLWKSTYFPHIFYLTPAQYQMVRSMEDQRLVLYGGQKADAQPRGSGKTTEGWLLGLWSIMNGHRWHFFIIRGSDSDAEEGIDDVKRELETNDLLCEDYPEVCIPIRLLEGQASRANSQTVNGQRTRIRYRTDSIILPTVAGSRASGRVISSSGYSKVRGWKIGGHRPDFVLMDELESDKSVRSQTMTEDIEHIISADVSCLGGPGKKIASLLRGTVIKRNCIIHRYTDREQHPEWQGNRQRALIYWPERMDLWNTYQEMLRDGQQDGTDKDGRKAMRFYIENRAEMDKGAHVAWEENFVRSLAEDGTPLEISALQHLMNELVRIGAEAFASEFQNDPLIEEGVTEVDAKLISSRLSGYPHEVVPPNCAYRLMEGIDLRGRELHYTVVAFGDDCTSSVIDYGIRRVNAPDTSLADIDKRPDVKNALELAMLDALRMRRDETAGTSTPYRDKDGNPANIYLHVVDSGYLPEVVYRFCFESGQFWRAVKGSMLRVGSSRYPEAVKENDSNPIVGNRWHASVLPTGFWLWHLDADFWKLFVHQRFLQDPEMPGGATLFGSNPKQHRMFANHLTAEEYDIASGKWNELSRWNHFFDCMYMAYAAASMCNINLFQRLVSPAKARAEPKQDGRREYFGGLDIPYFIGDRKQ